MKGKELHGRLPLVPPNVGASPAAPSDPRRDRPRGKHGGKKEDAPKTRREVSAGGIVFKVGKKGIVFGMIVDSYGKRAFPKGHVRRGETLAEAAAREVCEELGVCELRLIKRLGTNDIWFRDRFVHKGYLIHKYIHYYLFQAKPHARIAVGKAPKKGERVRAAAWVPMDQVLERSSYENMEPIVHRAIRSIQKDQQANVV